MAARFDGGSQTLTVTGIRFKVVFMEYHYDLTEDRMDDLKGWFLDYAAAFQSSDAYEQQSYVLKKEHSFRVAQAMRHMGRQLGLDGPALRTAEAMGLLHDVGRFEQYARYKTFVDAKSVNHADLGVHVLQASGILNTLDAPTRELVLKAIAYHNRLDIPEGEQATCLFFSRLLRDADKIDIYHVVTHYYLDKDALRSAAIELDLPDSSVVSPEVLTCLEEGRLINSRQLKSLNDFKLLQMGWVYDLNFSPAFQIVRDKGYLETIRRTLPPSPDIDRACARIGDYLHERLVHDQQTTGLRPCGSGREAVV